MNLQKMAETVLGVSDELEKGNDKKKQLGQSLKAIALEIKKLGEDEQRPITAETLKGIEVGGGDPRLKPLQRPGRNPSHKN